MTLSYVNSRIDSDLSQVWPTGIQAGDIAVLMYTSYGTTSSDLNIPGFVRISYTANYNSPANLAYSQVWVYGGTILSGGGTNQSGSCKAGGLTGTESGTALTMTATTADVPYTTLLIYRGTTGNYVVSAISGYDGNHSTTGPKSLNFMVGPQPGGHCIAQAMFHANGLGYGSTYNSVSIAGTWAATIGTTTTVSDGNANGFDCLRGSNVTGTRDDSNGFTYNVTSSSAQSVIGSGAAIEEFPPESFDPFGVQGFFGM